MENCQISNCNNNPIAICLHCQQQLCVEHLLQHNEELISQADKYCDEFNELTEQIKNMSFEEHFQAAEEDLNKWTNEQMKQLEKIYQQKLSELKQTHLKIEDKLEKFKQNQQTKLADTQRRLFNSQLGKQISLEQLNRMKVAVEQVREEIHQFQTNQCKITLMNNDQMNSFNQPNISNGNETNIQDGNKLTKSQLSPDAKPFEYKPKHQNNGFLSSNRENNFTGRLFDGCAFIGSSNKTM